MSNLSLAAAVYTNTTSSFVTGAAAMESIYAGNHQVYHEEYELIFNTLKIIWHNYLEEVINGGDVDVKVNSYISAHIPSGGPSYRNNLSLFFNRYSNIGYNYFYIIFNLFPGNCWTMKRLKGRQMKTSTPFYLKFIISR